MKSPHHPRPSGDRRIARLLIQALHAAGHKVEVMSQLRAWEGQGDAGAQQAICNRGMKIAKQLVHEIGGRPGHLKPDIWFSYHLYHKAPDWIGPYVSAELQLPYVVAEASYAPKQANGAWSIGHQQVVRALRQAVTVICLNPCDIPALERLLGSDNKLHRLMPFLDTSQIMPKKKQALRSEIAKQYNLDPNSPWLMTVAMMRNDVKLSSYQQLANVYVSLKRPGQYILVGDGTARSQVEALFSGQLGRHTCFTGQLKQSETLAIMTAGDIFVWPAIDEAIGMAILEAQACGLPVVVGKSGAISDIASDGVSGFICAPNDSRSMAASIAQLLDDASLREQFSLAARDKVSKQHSLHAASKVLETILSEVVS